MLYRHCNIPFLKADMFTGTVSFFMFLCMFPERASTHGNARLRMVSIPLKPCVRFGCIHVNVYDIIKKTTFEITGLNVRSCMAAEGINPNNARSEKRLYSVK